VIFTTLIFLLTPVFIYIFSRIYLNEKLNWRNILASIIIVLCVLYALFA
jgi:drug/metabolite transporter (DMT)-like permease